MFNIKNATFAAIQLVIQAICNSLHSDGIIRDDYFYFINIKIIDTIETLSVTYVRNYGRQCPAFEMNKEILPHNWFATSDGTPYTTSETLNYDKEKSIYILHLISNSWELKIPFEEFEKVLYPSTKFFPEFIRNNNNPIPCSSYTSLFDLTLYDNLCLCDENMICTNPNYDMINYKDDFYNKRSLLSLLKKRQVILFVFLYFQKIDILGDIPFDIIMKIIRNMSSNLYQVGMKKKWELAKKWISMKEK